MPSLVEYVYEANPFAVSPFYLHYLFIRISFIHLFFIFVCFFRQKNVTIKRLKKKTVFFFGMLYSFPCAVFSYRSLLSFSTLLQTVQFQPIKRPSLPSAMPAEKQEQVE